MQNGEQLRTMFSKSAGAITVPAAALYASCLRAALRIREIVLLELAVVRRKSHKIVKAEISFSLDSRAVRYRLVYFASVRA